MVNTYIPTAIMHIIFKVPKLHLQLNSLNEFY
jgi:hypothetical protein